MWSDDTHSIAPRTLSPPSWSQRVGFDNQGRGSMLRVSSYPHQPLVMCTGTEGPEYHMLGSFWISGRGESQGIPYLYDTTQHL